MLAACYASDWSHIWRSGIRAEPSSRLDNRQNARTRHTRNQCCCFDGVSARSHQYLSNGPRLQSRRRGCKQQYLCFNLSFGLDRPADAYALRRSASILSFRAAFIKNSAADHQSTAEIFGRSFRCAFRLLRNARALLRTGIQQTSSLQAS